VAEPADNWLGTGSSNSSLPTGEGVIIDIGTGDGTFVYQSALRNPNKFFIGIDASARPLEKISEKIHRNPRKGGAPNALFVEAAVENLPEELDEVADEVHIHFPWGSLLRAVVTGEEAALRSIRRICAPEAELEVVVGLDPSRDAAEMARLGIPAVSLEYIDRVLRTQYASAGFSIREYGCLDRSQWSKMSTSWAKRLNAPSGRSVHYWLAEAMSESQTTR
jgi:16S rRNA (adenine(1408)-N(1))-methyltransferase